MSNKKVFITGASVVGALAAGYGCSRSNDDARSKSDNKLASETSEDNAVEPESNTETHHSLDIGREKVKLMGRSAQELENKDITGDGIDNTASETLEEAINNILAENKNKAAMDNESSPESTEDKETVAMNVFEAATLENSKEDNEDTMDDVFI